MFELLQVVIVCCFFLVVGPILIGVIAYEFYCRGKR